MAVQGLISGSQFRQGTEAGVLVLLVGSLLVHSFINCEPVGPLQSKKLYKNQKLGRGIKLVVGFKYMRNLYTDDFTLCLREKK